MKPAEPFEIHRPVEGGKPSWAAVGGSALFHLLVIALLLLRPPEGASVPPPPHRPDGSEPQPIWMPLPAPPKPKVKAPTATPPPLREQILGPDSKRPDAAVPKEAVPEHPPADPVPDPAGATRTAEQSPTENKTANPDPVAPESRQSHFPTLGELLATQSHLAQPAATDAAAKALAEANRGSDEAAPSASARASSSMMGKSGISSEDGREWRPSFPEAAGSCVEIPDLGKNPDGTPVLATVIGRVFEANNRTPLAGAHLQIIGTTFTAFTDGNGLYRLEFDPRLLKKCRIQYVQVVAPGHDSQMLTLAIGRKVQSDDVLLRRR